MLGSLALLVAFVAGTTLGPDLAAAASRAFESVLIANTAANPVPVSVQGPVAVTVGNFPSTQPVTVGNFPSTQPVSGNVTVTGTVATTGSAAVVVAHGYTTLEFDVPTFILPLTDLRAFSKATLYLTSIGPAQNCQILAAATETGDRIRIRAVTKSADVQVQTFEPAEGLILDPAPPFITLGCVNDGGADGRPATYGYMLVAQPR
jgi:hypothetical protein